MRAYKHVLSYMFVCIQSYCKFWKLGKQAAPMGKFWAKNHGEFVAQKKLSKWWILCAVSANMCMHFGDQWSAQAYSKGIWPTVWVPDTGILLVVGVGSQRCPNKALVGLGGKDARLSWRILKILPDFGRNDWAPHPVDLIAGPANCLGARALGWNPHSLQPRPFGSTVWGGRTPWIFNGFERWWVEYNPSIQFIGLASRARKLPLRWAKQFCLERSPGTYSILGAKPHFLLKHIVEHKIWKIILAALTSSISQRIFDEFGGSVDILSTRPFCFSWSQSGWSQALCSCLRHRGRPWLPGIVDIIILI